MMSDDAVSTTQSSTTHGTDRLLADGRWQGAWFDGHWRVEAARLPVIEPATGDRLADVALAGPDEVRLAAGQAHAAQPGWAALDIASRAEILQRAAALFEQHASEIEDWIIRECGSVRPKAAFEIHVAVGELRHASAQVLHPPGHLVHSPDPQRMSWARRVPLGVVSVITPWNFPLLLAMRSVAPALMTGNAVLLKPDPQTPVSGGVLIARVLEEAGLPAGVLSVLPGAAETGEAVVTDERVRLVTFTGSTAVGRRVGALASGHLKKVALELGGNSPLIVLDDADLDRAVDAGAFGSFFHQGQICMATSRHIVHRRVLDAYTERLVNKARSLRVGNPALERVQLGPMINRKQVDRALALLSASVAAGAKVLTGGGAMACFFSPLCYPMSPLRCLPLPKSCLHRSPPSRWPTMTSTPSRWPTPRLTG